MLITYFLLLAGAVLISQAPFTPDPDPIEKTILVHGRELLADPNIRSVSIGVVRKGKVYKYHLGQLGNGKSPDEHTLYEIASLTKTFTGMVLTRAILDKKVALDDDIRDFLPGNFPNLAFGGHAITFRHLLTHSSGLPPMLPDKPDLFSNPDRDSLPFQINALQDGYTRENFLHDLRGVTIDTIPGARFSYSNAGANLLGFCLEQMYSMPFEDLLNQLVLAPLKMHTTYIQVPDHASGNIAPGFNTNGLPMPQRAAKELNAEGGILSTLDDMLAYLGLQLHPTDPQIRLAHGDLWNGKYGDYGNGFFWQIKNSRDKPRLIFQNGGAFGTSSWTAFIPDLEIGVFLITNVSGPDIHQKLSVTAENLLRALE